MKWLTAFLFAFLCLMISGIEAQAGCLANLFGRGGPQATCSVGSGGGCGLFSRMAARRLAQSSCYGGGSTSYSYQSINYTTSSPAPALYYPAQVQVQAVPVQPTPQVPAKSIPAPEPTAPAPLPPGVPERPTPLLPAPGTSFFYFQYSEPVAFASCPTGACLR